ncbi:hypothetical protein KY285_026052 [Solanum tuberosum]|nr:hypothetical protein KY285_026052 [Solanum tuberosum]
MPQSIGCLINLVEHLLLSHPLGHTSQGVLDIGHYHTKQVEVCSHILRGDLKSDATTSYG